MSIVIELLKIQWIYFDTVQSWISVKKENYSFSLLVWKYVEFP